MPWPNLAAFWLHLLPLAASFRWGGRTPPARRWIGVLFALLFLEDCAMLYLAMHGHHNLWVVYLGNPVQTSIVLLAYAAWESPSRWRSMLRAAIPVYLLASAVLWFAAENRSGFSRFSSPLQSIIIVTVATVAIIRHAQAGTLPPWRTDIFWVSTGLLTYYGTAVLLEPISSMLVRSHPELVRIAFVVRAGISIVAYVLITVGLLCRIAPRNSGGFSLPEASPY